MTTRVIVREVHRYEAEVELDEHGNITDVVRVCNELHEPFDNDLTVEKVIEKDCVTI